MCPPAEIKIFTLETACPIKNFIRLPFHHRPICRQILRQISDQVALTGHTGGAVGEPGGGGGGDTGGAVYEVGVKSGSLDLLIRQVPGQLMDDGADHFQMAKLLCPDVC